MKMAKLCFVVLFLGLVNVVFAQQLHATMEEGQTMIFALGERDYEVDVLIIEDTNPPTVTLKINGQVTSQLIQNSTYELQDSVILTVLEITLSEGWEPYDTVTLTFRNYCGDHECKNNENCNLCSADCGCQEGYTCDQITNDCRQVTCGDNRCDINEDCDLDSCCGGRITDLKTDIRHCGACAKQCGYKEVCAQGACLREGQQNTTASNTSCGDKICQQDEKSCCSDCGCEGGYSCIEDVCVRDACTSADDCNDNNICTADTCTGAPKKCTRQEQAGCSLEDECVQQKEIRSTGNVSSFCNVRNEWEKQRTDGAQCDEGYECSSGKCQSSACYTEESKGLIQRLLQWLKRLFAG